jgi:hypothetical protein
VDTEELEARVGMESRWRIADKHHDAAVDELTKSSFVVDQCLNTTNGHTLGSRATVALVHLICSLEAGAEMEESANVFLEQRSVRRRYGAWWGLEMHSRF